MEKLYQEYKQKNFVVLAVAVKDRKQDAIDFVKELKLTYPIALDPEAQSRHAIRRLGIARDLSDRPKGEGLARGWGPADWYNAAARKLIKDFVDGKTMTEVNVFVAFAAGCFFFSLSLRICR